MLTSSFISYLSLLSVSYEGVLPILIDHKMKSLRRSGFILLSVDKVFPHFVSIAPGYHYVVTISQPETDVV